MASPPVAGMKVAGNRERFRFDRGRSSGMGMTDNRWKLTTIALLLVMVTALVTGLVVANWSGNQQVATGSSPPPPPMPPSPEVANSAPTAGAAPSSPAPVPAAQRSATKERGSAIPPQASI